MSGRGVILILTMMLFSLGSKTNGCRIKCEGEKGLAESLRPFFSTCLKEKLGVVMNWKYLVNYVVWDDIWYTATESFYCKNKGESCWVNQAKYLIPTKSPYLKPLRQCIRQYAAWNSSNTARPCERADHPVYRPRIVQKFTPMHGCPLSHSKYANCLSSSTLYQTRTVMAKPGQTVIKPKYNFVELSRFLTDHRTNCKTSPLGPAYVRSCSGSNQQTSSGSKPISVVRGKRALTLSDLLAQAGGGQLNFRLSSNGKPVILPSGPLVPKIRKTPKCLPQKLQMVIKAGTVLSKAVSKCNVEASKPLTKRVSTSFRVAAAVRKEPGQVGTCKSDQVWSKWYNRDNPSAGTGDLEYFTRIRRSNPLDVCLRPTAVQALLARNNQSYSSGMQNVKISPMFGLSCHNYKQKGRRCEDYKVRFCCHH